ncbi:MAG: hypothetical protein KKG59_06475 [Nanoarchaeota archaeon]|nr:hypothetical protein [Nanoarchaeota archaeon]
MAKRQFIIFSLLLIVLSGFVMAETVEFDVQKINTSIFKGESASYQLRIVNHQDFEDKFQVSSSSARFVVIVQPRPETVPVAPNSFEEYIVYVNPKASIGTGPFGVPIKMKSLVSGDIYTMNFPIHIMDPDIPVGVYPPNPSLSVEIPEDVDPKEGIKLNLQLKNNNPRELDEVAIAIESDLFEKSYSTSLNGMEEKGNEILFDLHPLERPGKHSVTIKVIFEDKVYAEETKYYEIIGYTDIADDRFEDDLLFRSSRMFTFKNSGNMPELIIQRVETNWFRRIFSQTTPKAATVNLDGKTLYEWKINLPAQDMYGEAEVFEVKIVENYRIPVIVLLVIIVLIILYYIFRSPVICEKDAQLSHSREGVTQIKVKLFIKNRSRTKMQKVKIIDRVPAIAEFAKSDAIGTMHPSQISKSAKKGTIVKYEMHTLEPFEERIITYHMKSKLKIIGGMNLKPARVKFEAKKGKERRIVSNDVKLRKK